MKYYAVLFFLLVASAYGYYDLMADNGIFVKSQIYETNLEPKVYFNSYDNITGVFLNLINNSTDIKCAFYDLEDDQIINALIQKNATVFIEDDYYYNQFIESKTKSKMHNKFCVFDGDKVFTGSLNPTKRGLSGNDNNMILIYSKYLAQNYLDELDEFENNIYGQGSLISYPKIILNNDTIIENLFCPDDDCQTKVIEILNIANYSIYFMIFSFTDQLIADTLVKKKRSGLDVQGVFEKTRLNMQYEKYKYLNVSSIKIYPDRNKYTMHHKVFIIDEEIVITGSYNPTAAGARSNDENILIITDKKIAKKYLIEFERLRK